MIIAYIRSTCHSVPWQAFVSSVLIALPYIVVLAYAIYTHTRQHEVFHVHRYNTYYQEHFKLTLMVESRALRSFPADSRPADQQIITPQHKSRNRTNQPRHRSVCRPPRLLPLVLEIEGPAQAPRCSVAPLSRRGH